MTTGTFSNSIYRSRIRQLERVIKEQQDEIRELKWMLVVSKGTPLEGNTIGDVRDIE